ncbi:hypothetical protein [Kitasatospora sp. NPDC050543]|uniref:hypothetical protein n=1 Tax=Kitasatospora sp. NPDC050543 TaxID=3364054 RepID=UPI0037B20D8D
MNATVTLGGLAVGIVLHIREFGPGLWATLMKKAGKSGPPRGDAEGEAKGKFDIKAHVPYLVGDAIGMLAIATPGGFIGVAAAKISGISNTIGDMVLSSGTGSPTTAATRAAAHTMDSYGSLVVLLLIATVFVLRKSMPKPQRKQLITGLWSGSTIGLSAGAAGITAAVLIPVAEQLGHAIGGQL